MPLAPWPRTMTCPWHQSRLGEACPLTDKLTGMGLKNLVWIPGSREVKQALEDQVAIRRAALKNGNRTLGFPTITFPCEMAPTWMWKP
jgi:CO dehydrogenase/acetyl-CoA synthase gamma subunit (corrinoid Fe-S protein)